MVQAEVRSLSDLLEEKNKFEVLIIKAKNLVETIYNIFISYSWLEM